MKTFKVICSATALALFLSIPVYAEDSNPGNVHDPGKAHCVYQPPAGEVCTGSTELITTGDSDFSLSAVIDMLWTMASIF
jgi:hypothetical protein